MGFNFQQWTLRYFCLVLNFSHCPSSSHLVHCKDRNGLAKPSPSPHFSFPFGQVYEETFVHEIEEIKGRGPEIEFKIQTT